MRDLCAASNLAGNSHEDAGEASMMVFIPEGQNLWVQQNITKHEMQQSCNYQQLELNCPVITHADMTPMYHHTNLAL